MKKMIVGKFNNEFSQNCYSFACDFVTEKNIGDYAIVENKQGFDLVKIIGITIANNEFPYGHKSVIRIIKNDDLVRDIPDIDDEFDFF